MLRQTLPALIVVAGLSAPLAHAADAAADASTQAQPSYTLTANMALSTQYRYRGLMQTDNKPEISGGFDFTHNSGFYLGNWDSNISWLSDEDSRVSAPIEMDFYGGYRGNIVDDVPFDVGVLEYYYPGDYPSGFTRPDTTELYGSVGYGPMTFKYSYSPTNLFGFAETKGSQYFDLSGNFDTGVWGLTVNAHAGYQYVHNLDNGSYFDWKLGVTKDLGKGLSVSVAYIDTNADKTVYTNSRGAFMGRATALASISKTF
jgi:uncharacterized protein (TIGR02001 family)